MKKALFFALAGLLAAAVPALAHPPAPANVNFTSERGVPFGLVLDGRPLTRGAARQVHVDRLVPGLHWADFSVPTAYGGAVRFRSRVWLEPGLETSFVLIARPGRPLDLRQVGAVALCGPNYGTGRSYGYQDGRNGYDDDDDNDDSDYRQGGNQAPYGYGGNAPAYPAPNGGYNGYNNSPGYGGNSPYPPSGGAGYYPGSSTSSYRLMAPQDVNALVQAVQQRPIEASKLNIAKEALGQSSIEADDLKRLLRSLNFEASRVDLAKFAYPHVADRQNFYRVYEAFDFDGSTREVQQAVGSGQN